MVLQDGNMSDKIWMPFTPISVYLEGLYFVIIEIKVHRANEPV